MIYPIGLHRIVRASNVTIAGMPNVYVGRSLRRHLLRRLFVARIFI